MSKTPRPLLILSDNPLGSSGLGRIGRELAQRIATLPEFRLGYAALGGTTDFSLPYQLYPFSKITRNREVLELPEIWRRFAGDEKGIILTIWNHTWLEWLLKPSSPEMEALLQKVELWGYIPVDSTQANGKLPMPEVLRRFDRLLAYTKFGADAIFNTLQPDAPIEHLPHGTDISIFHPLDKQECRRNFGLDLDIFLVGCVAANHARKDWGLAFEVVSKLSAAALWAHTDNPVGDWNLPELQRIHDVSAIITSFHYTDEAMARLYGACDVTLGIGHEGWGLCLTESLACGVPVVTMGWAGQTEYMDGDWSPKPVAFAQGGPYSYLRPVHDAEEWEMYARGARKSSVSLLDPEFTWDGCWAKWKEWLTR